MDWVKDAGIPLSPNHEENIFVLQDLWSGENLTNIDAAESILEGSLLAHQSWAYKLIPFYDNKSVK